VFHVQNGRFWVNEYIAHRIFLIVVLVYKKVIKRISRKKIDYMSTNKGHSLALREQFFAKNGGDRIRKWHPPPPLLFRIGLRRDHRVHRVATAAFWRTFSDEGKMVLAGEGGGCTPTPSLYIYHHQ
jgi:hypothetical protein